MGRARRWWVRGAMLVSVVAGCGGEARETPSSPDAGTPGAGTSGGSGATGGVGTLSGGAGGAGAITGGAGGIGAIGGGGPAGSGGACLSFVADFASTNIYFMYDQSGSMSSDAGGVTRWELLKNGVRDFLNAPANAGLGVGIQYFGRAICAEDCNVVTYAQPEVPIGTLPGIAQSVMSSLDRHAPSTETPTDAALTGAIQYAQSYKTANPSQHVVVLLVTDGIPEAPCSGMASCSANPPTLQATVQAAAQGLSGSPPISTFVLGVGPNLDPLNQIAAAGGTSRAFLVSTAPEVLQALGQIRSTSVACAFPLPPAPGLDPRRVNVQYTPTGSAKEMLFYVGDASRCDAARGGWHFDNPAAPSGILLCPATCDRVRASGGRLEILIGCAPNEIPP